MSLISFFSLSLLTAPGRVMTPRPASEQLVAAALDHLDGRAGRVVDVGTGSGAIAVAIASAAPEAEVWATDISEAAVALARANVERHGLAERVTVRRGDLLAPVPGAIDLVVANLPYLPESEASHHPDLEPEPAEAVFSPGDGLEPYRRLVTAAGDRLAGGGALLVQLRRRVLRAGWDELPDLRARVGASSEDRQVPIQLPRADLDPVLVPLGPLQVDVPREDVLAERLEDQLGAGELLDRLAEGLG